MLDELHVRTLTEEHTYEHYDGVLYRFDLWKVYVVPASAVDLRPFAVTMYFIAKCVSGRDVPVRVQIEIAHAHDDAVLLGRIDAALRDILNGLVMPAHVSTSVGPAL